jgi:Tol biopolymer transport system component
VPSLTHLAYVPTPGRVLRVLDPAGTVRKTIPLNEAADMIAVAPNGRNVVVALGNQLQIVDLSSGVAERLTYDAGRYRFPAWSHDSRRISYRFQRLADPVFRIMVIDAKGGTPKEVGTVNAEPEAGGVSTWMPDGSALIGNHRGPRGDHDILRLLLDGKGTIEPVTNAPFGEYNARVSPDGRHLAFLSLELGGGFTVFVQPLQPGAARRRVSPQSNCTDPNWSPDGRQLFYRCSGRIHAATRSQHAGTLMAGDPQLIAERPLRGGIWLYGVLPGGGLVTIEQAQPASSVRVLLNWYK